jgi:hypothetical protein
MGLVTDFFMGNYISSAILSIYSSRILETFQRLYILHHGF